MFKKGIMLLVMTTLVALLGASVANAGVYRDTIMADNPVGYWQLNEASNTVPAVNEVTTVNNGTYAGGAVVGMINLAGGGKGIMGIVSRLTGGRIRIYSDLVRALLSKSFSRGLKEGSSRLLRWLTGRGKSARESLWGFETGGER